MDDLITFLRAQLDEDERIARAATGGPWRAHDTHLGQYGYAATILSGEGNDTDLRAWLPSMSNEPWDEKRNVWADAEHIAAHDPARVLREIEAKKKLVKLHGRATLHAGGGAQYFDTTTACRSCEANYQFPELSWPCPTLRLFASVYEDRDGYQEGWAP